MVANAIDVQGVLRMPGQGELAYSQVTAADVYLTDAGHEFVQAGWYLGTASGLPMAATPRMFIGENVGSTGEKLVAGPALSWSSYHRFEIFHSGAYAYFYLDGAYQFQSSYEHVPLGHAAFNGEVDDNCSRMGARAYHNTGLLRTLQYTVETSSGTADHLFTDHYFSSDPSLISVSAGDVATNYAYGG